MKPFSLEEYLKNPDRKVVTRDGRKVTRFLCTDAKTKFPIIALVEVSPGSTDECLRTFTKDGRYFGEESSPCDLFFAPEKHEGWINIKKSSLGYYCTSQIFQTKEDAENHEIGGNCLVVTEKVEWEE